MASSTPHSLGRTIQLFLVDGDPNGLRVASINGWTGHVLIAGQTAFGKLLARQELANSGIYILHGRNPENTLQSRAYIGEADHVRGRIDRSAARWTFWETALVVTTSDKTLTKGHVRYLEARLIEITKAAGRVILENSQLPEAERRHLPEADRANMEGFLSNLAIVLPVIGLDLLKPQLRQMDINVTLRSSHSQEVRFEIRHKSGVKAQAIEQEGEFVVLQGSQALKDTNFAHNGYARLKAELIENKVLEPSADGRMYIFARSFAFSSPSAASAVVLDHSSNGRTTWRVVGSELTYHAWQEQQGSNRANEHS